MDLIQKQNLKELIEKEKGWCVSIYMPTHRVVTHTLEDHIRFKNLVKQAEEFLLKEGVRRIEIEKLFEPTKKILENPYFWQHHSNGLAVFLTSEIFVHYRLPLAFEELVVVANRFHLKPLLPIFVEDGRFYILAISQNELRFFQCTPYSFSEIELADVPKSLAETLKYDTCEPHLQFHTGMSGWRGKGGKSEAIFHLRAENVDGFKINISRYFHQVNHGLHSILKEEHSPLLLACVDYLFPIYRQANTYPHLVNDEILGNPELISAKELHASAWPIVEPLFKKKQAAAAERYNQLAQTEKVSKDLEVIIPATYQGRVDLLFVAVGIQKWGTFDSINNAVKVHSKELPGDEDLLNLAAFKTLIHKGTVYALPPQKMPNAAMLAAIFRY